MLQKKKQKHITTIRGKTSKTEMGMIESKLVKGSEWEWFESNLYN